MKLSLHLPETLPSSSKRLVSWPEFRVANPSLAGFQVSVQASALLDTRIVSGHIYAVGWTLPAGAGLAARRPPPSPRKRRRGKPGTRLPSGAQDTDGLNIHNPGLTIPEGQVLQFPKFASLRPLPATEAVASCRSTG